MLLDTGAFCVGGRNNAETKYSYRLSQEVSLRNRLLPTKIRVEYEGKGSCHMYNNDTVQIVAGIAANGEGRALA